MLTIPTLTPLCSLLLCAMLGCQPNARRSDGSTAPDSDGHLAADAAPVLSVQIVPLTEPQGTFVSVDRSGELRRFEGRSLTLTRVGRARLEAAEVAALVDLAGRVPREQRMGEGIVEGDVYRLAIGDELVAAFIEPLMPEEMRRLLDRLGPLLERAPLNPNTDWYIAAEPVADARRARLASSGSPAIVPASLSPGARGAVLTASAAPLALRPISRSIADEVSGGGSSREPFVAIDESTWMQLGIWGPP